MLKPVFDPLHGAAGNARRRRDQNDVREYALLDPEAAAGIRRRPQPQPIAGHLQRPRDYGMDAERSLEVRQYVESVFARAVVRHDSIGFDRRTGIAGISDIDRDAPGGGG